MRDDLRWESPSTAQIRGGAMELAKRKNWQWKTPQVAACGVFFVQFYPPVFCAVICSAAIK